jgi:hypothetical protein
MGDEILVWQDREIRFDVPVGYADIFKTFKQYYFIDNISIKKVN